MRDRDVEGVVNQDVVAVVRKAAAVYHRDEAIKAAQAGDMQTAITEFQNALDRDPAIDLDPATEELEQEPATVAEELAAAAED